MKHSKKRLLLSFALPLIAAIAALFLVAHYSRPARYNGRDAYEWAIRLEWPVDPKSQAEAAAALQTMGTKAVPLLRQRLSGKEPLDQKVRQWLGAKLPASIGRAFTRDLKPISLTSVRCSAASGLGALGTNAAAAAPDLVRALQASDRQTMWAAANALGAVGEAGVLPLIPLLNDPSPDVRHAATYALGKIGPAALAATPALVQRLAESNSPIRASAIYALTRIGPLAGPTVLKLVEERRGEERRNAARALVGINARSHLSRPVLTEMAKDPDPESRAVAIETMTLLLLLRTNDMPVYLTGLTDSNATVRLAAAKAVAEAAPRARAATPTLTALKENDPDATVRAAANVALARIAEANR